MADEGAIESLIDLLSCNNELIERQAAKGKFFLSFEIFEIKNIFTI